MVLFLVKPTEKSFLSESAAMGFFSNGVRNVAGCIYYSGKRVFLIFDASC